MNIASMKIAGVSLDERTFALLLIACSIIVGISSPSLATRLEPIALPALFLVVLASLVPFAQRAPRDLIAINRNVMRVLCWQQLVLPSLVIALGILCRLPDHIISLLVVTACSGALFAAPALAALLDLNQRQSLQSMVLSTLLMPITLYMFLGLISLQTGTIHLELEVYSLRILIYLGVPALLFLGYRRVDRALTSTGRRNAEMMARWTVVFALAVFGIGMMKSVAERVITNPKQVYFFFCLTTVLCVSMLLFTTIVMYRFGRTDALTAALVSGFRNVGLGYALIGDMMGPDLSVYVGVGLLPVFIAPLILRLMASRRADALQTPG